MYQHLRPARTGRDWKLLFVTAFAVLFLLLLAAPLVFSSRLLYGFHVFADELADSFVYGEHHACLTADYAGKQHTVSDTGATALYTAIVQNGAGRPERLEPEGDSLVLRFGDGSSLQLRDMAGGEKRTWLCYTRADGSQYVYSTVKLGFETALDYIRR